MNKFWNWVRNEDTGAAELIFNGPISEDTWFGDEITPAMFRNELSKVSGDLTVWLNSPGGDVFAASQIRDGYPLLFHVHSIILLYFIYRQKATHFSSCMQKSPTTSDEYYFTGRGALCSLIYQYRNIHIIFVGYCE